MKVSGSRSSHQRQLKFESMEARLTLTADCCVEQREQPVAADLAHESSLMFAASRVSRGPLSIASSSTNLGVLQGAMSIAGSIGFGHAEDSMRFTLDKRYEVLMGLDGLHADADLFVYDASQNLLASSLRGGISAESLRLELDAGDYYISVRSFRPWSFTRYALSLNASVVAADGAGNTFDTAANIGQFSGTRKFEGAVGFGVDSADFVRFDMANASRLNLELSGLGDDIDLNLYASNHRIVATSHDGAVANESIDAWLAAGTYYLEIVPFENARSDYALSISVGGAVDPPISTPPPVLVPPSPIVAPSPATPPMVTTPPAAPTTSPVAPVTQPPAIQVPVPSILTDVTYFGGANEWGVNYVGAPEAWAAGYHGQGVTVAVIDSGVQVNHPDLQNAIWVNVDEIPGDGIDNDRNGYVDDRFGWDFAGGDNNPSDGNSHGTHVAGIIAAQQNSMGATGVASGARIMPVRVLGDDGAGSNSRVAQGIRYAVDNGADIINLSLGGGNSSQILTALQYAAQHDVFVVAASGNESADIPGFPAQHSASLSSVLSVGAFDSHGQIASFSNRVGSSRAVQIDGPGVGIYSTVLDGQYRRMSGTSMATPFVAGVAALTLSANPELTSSQLRDVLTQSATEQSGGSDSIGIVNAARAIPLAMRGGVVMSASPVTVPSTNNVASARVRARSITDFDEVRTSAVDASFAAAPSGSLATLRAGLRDVPSLVSPSVENHPSREDGTAASVPAAFDKRSIRRHTLGHPESSRSVDEHVDDLFASLLLKSSFV